MEKMCQIFILNNKKHLIEYGKFCYLILNLKFYRNNKNSLNTVVSK